MASLAFGTRGLSGKAARMAAARRMRPVLRKLTKVAYPLVVLLFGTVLFLLTKIGVIPVWMEEAGHTLVSASTKLGLVVRDIKITNIKHASESEVISALSITEGETPILSEDMAKWKEALLQLKWVKNVTIERRLPGSLVVNIEERTPFAIWQHNGVLKLVDTDGVVIDVDDFAEFKALPLVVGANAYLHTGELFRILSVEKSLFARVKSVVWRGERRWDIVLDNNIEIMLPENTHRNEAEEAWHRLADMQTDSSILERKIKRIDLRFSDRAFITPLENETVQIFPDKAIRSSEDVQEQHEE